MEPVARRVSRAGANWISVTASVNYWNTSWGISTRLSPGTQSPALLLCGLGKLGYWSMRDHIVEQLNAEVTEDLAEFRRTVGYAESLEVLRTKLASYFAVHLNDHVEITTSPRERFFCEFGILWSTIHFAHGAMVWHFVSCAASKQAKCWTTQKNFELVCSSSRPKKNEISRSVRKLGP